MDLHYRQLTQVPRLSLEERDRRWANLRREMALKEIDCLLIFSSDGCTSNLRYVTHISNPGIGLFPIRGEPVIFGGLPHTVHYALGYQNWVSQLRSGARPDEVVIGIKEMGFEKGKIGVVGFGSMFSRMVPEAIPYTAFLKIQHSFPEATFTNETSLVERLRMIKSKEELKMLKKAAEIANMMFQAMVNTARPGRKECEVYAGMLHASTAHGGELGMILMDIGKYPLLHARGFPLSERRMKSGDMLIIEWHSNYGGYQVGIEHSLSLGEPMPQYKEIHQVCSAVFQNCLDKLKPGVSMGEVIEDMRKPVEEAGMAYVECGIHGHGLGSPEFPSVVFGGPNCLVQKHGLAVIPPVIIEENMVFGTNIDIHNPKWRKDTGLMFGDTLVVTKNGAKKLSQIPLELTVT